jgi:hypothetical protein
MIKVCRSCNVEHLREYKVRNNKMLHRHQIGRYCSTCDNELFDNLVNMNETVPETRYHEALEHIKRAELIIIIGTNMRTNPTSELIAKRANKLCIVNTRPTSKDGIADLKIHTDPEMLLRLLTSTLNVHVDPFILKQTLLVGTEVITTTKLKLMCKIFVKSNSAIHPVINRIDCTTLAGDTELGEKSITRMNDISEFIFRPVDPATTVVMLKVYFNVLPLNGEATYCTIMYQLNQRESQVTKPGRCQQQFVIEYNATDHSFVVRDGLL